MLDPYERRSLMELLRPPEGYSLDYAIGTTFSLDLEALMTAPVAFTRFEADSDFHKADPLVIMESLRRYMEKITIFCHTSRIKPPGNRGNCLSAFLEGSVFQALPQNGDGSFHPKVWALRFISKSKTAPVAYRLLCLSRNLTFDRSWDTALVLDGILSERKNAISINNPLGDFIESLPLLVNENLPKTIQNRIEQMNQEIRRVKFNPPQGFSEIVFHPIGISNRKPDVISGRIDRLLVISPFLTKGCLDRLSALGKENILVSRLDSLQKISPECLGKFKERLYLKEEAHLDWSDSDESLPSAQEPDRNIKRDESSQPLDERKLNGLHAKLYVADAGSEGRIWTGSANATGAAFGKNVEFLVELRGKKKFCGIDAVLNGGHDANDDRIVLRSLLDSLTVLREVPKDELEPLKSLAEKTRIMIATAGLSAHVTATGEKFKISIKGKKLIIPEEVKVNCRPITLPGFRAVPITSDMKADFKDLFMIDISTFFAFDINVSYSSKILSEAFVLKLPLHGAPDIKTRTRGITKEMLKDEKEVLRLIMLYLSLERESIIKEAPPNPPEPIPHSSRSHIIVPLFESMVKLLNEDPQRIDDLNNLISDLKSNPDTSNLLPKGLDEIWESIWKARKNMKEAGHEKS
jgi:hypothetical protein